jgi:hypothetical protein
MLYAAPEQLTGNALDGRGDQYALSTTAFQRLTGSPLSPQRPRGRHLPHLSTPALAPSDHRAGSRIGGAVKRSFRPLQHLRELRDSTELSSARTSGLAAISIASISSLAQRLFFSNFAIQAPNWRLRRIIMLICNVIGITADPKSGQTTIAGTVQPG